MDQQPMNPNPMPPPQGEILRVPPHSIEAEQAVLGSLMVAPDIHPRVGKLLKPDMFYNRTHRIIYEAVARLIALEKPIDLIIVSEYLEEKDQLDASGGLAYLGELARNTPSAVNAPAYAEVIRDRYISRQLIGVANNVAEAAFAGHQDVQEQLAGALAGMHNVNNLQPAKQKAIDMPSVMDRTMEKLQERSKHPGQIRGLPTGYKHLDDYFSGLEPGELYLVGARPSMGKTTFALNIVEHQLKNDAMIPAYPLIFTQEMSDERIAEKMIASASGVEQKLIQRGFDDDQKWARVSEVVPWLRNPRLWVEDASNRSVMDLRFTCRDYARKHGRPPSLIVIDYLQLMTGGAGSENRTQEISAISRGLKALAKEFNCAVLALSQLSRKLEERADKRPMNSDLRESGQIEQDADVIIMLYRDVVYNANSQYPNIAEAIVTKARNGELGKQFMEFQGACARFLPKNDYHFDIPVPTTDPGWKPGH